MDNNYDNTPKENETSGQPSGDSAGNDSMNLNAGASDDQNQYTDPNAGQQTNYQQYQYASQNQNSQQSAYNYNQQSNGYNYGQQNSGYNYSQQNQNGSYNYNQNNGYNYQDNYSYNTGNNNQIYEPGQDTSPMTMGDWLLTLLAAMIPCVGIVLYFVWAFSKTTNVNRRNFCRAQLIMMGVVLVIYLIFIAMFGTMIFRSGFYY
ncbi:hypothetical protein AALD22_11635 [Lachnospiraceae bacterium 56-18]|jgi:hypothetical protein|uniref:hypothetical protein n=1 Tax=Sporofaciens sp. JLR.KK001 TaxID=3112621 RepID=UPI002FEF59B5